ncbi:MAG: TlpA disulfide reductase family protein [Bacteroidota bacterium]|jgi:thiol-disulfide isomerase/thioredoxin
MKQLYIALLALTLSACQPKTDPQQSAQQQQPAPQYKKNVSLLQTIETAGNNQIPNFSWFDETGKKISFAEYSKGKPVVLNFWATWCGPCIKETPDLVELSKEFEPQGALFIGISADLGDDAMDLVTSFTKEYSVPYQIVIDNQGDLQQAIGGLRGYPTTFYVDKNGAIVKKLVGLQSKERFTQELKSVI